MGTVRERRSTLRLCALAGAVVLTSCASTSGSVKSSNSSNTIFGASGSTSNASAVIATTNPNQPSTTSETPGTSSASASATTARSNTGAPDATSGDFCKAKVTGAVNEEWQRGGGVDAILVSYWLSDAARKTLGDPSKVSFILNCNAGNGGLSFTATANTTPDQFPQAPKTYPVTKDAKPGQVSPIFTLKDQKIVWSVADAGGSFEITKFDGTTLEGSFTIPFHNGFAALAGQADQTLTLAGTFHFTCGNNPSQKCG